MDKELRVKVFRDVEHAIDILESVRTMLVDRFGEKAEDVTDTLHRIIKDLDHDILEEIANLPNE